MNSQILYVLLKCLSPQPPRELQHLIHRARREQSLHGGITPIGEGRFVEIGGFNQV